MILDGKFYNYKKIDYDNELKKCIEETCKYCIDNANVETKEKINHPIMMLGKIQSGKTRAFTGLIALAFDNNFDIVFILTKNNKALVEQTITRMKNEFKPFKKDSSIIISDIIKTKKNISGYELEKKNIIVAKKQQDNIDKIIEFIEKYSISANKKCLIIDDEADTTGIGYEKIKGTDSFTLRTVSSKVNEMRGTLDGCVFVEVTATPYALYLQPDFNDNLELQAIKPKKTILVPYGDEYIGGEYYFMKSQDENHPASLIYQTMSNDECSLVSYQKQKGKKSKIEDRRSFKEEEILERDDRMTTFKKGIVNFIVGTIALNSIYNENANYAYVIHTTMKKDSHFNLQSIAETFINKIKERLNFSKVESILLLSYEDIKQSIEANGYKMISFENVKEQFYAIIDKGYYSIDVVNSDTDINDLLDEDSGELSLRTPCSIFVGGSVLDRGVTIPNMIGFYYGRNPVTMQQDTVLQHSRMFGYRKKILPVTRFYTTERIYSNMEKITEIDELLRSDITAGNQGEGVYFITNKEQDSAFGTGGIKPCSPSKINISNVILLKPNKRILPIGFSPVTKTEYTKNTKKIENILKNDAKDFTINISKNLAVELLELVYNTIICDDDSPKFIPLNEFITTFKYIMDTNENVNVIVRKRRKITKYTAKNQYIDSPEDGNNEGKEAKKLAIDTPVLILIQEDGLHDSWNNRPFWWPILVVPKNVRKTMYATKITGEKIIVPKK